MGQMDQENQDVQNVFNWANIIYFDVQVLGLILYLKASC